MKTTPPIPFAASQLGEARHVCAAGSETAQSSNPVVFITAQRDENARSNPLKEEAVACLLKPFSDIDLLQAIRTALGTE